MNSMTAISLDSPEVCHFKIYNTSFTHIFLLSSGYLSFNHLTKTITNFLQFTFPVFGIYNSGQKSLV